MSDEDKILGLLSMIPGLVNISCREAYEIINSTKVQMTLFLNWDALRKEPDNG